MTSIPAINAIRSRHKNCHIILLTDKNSKNKYVSSWDVLKTTKYLDQVIFYDPNKLFNLKYSYNLVNILRKISPTDIYNLVQRIELHHKWRDYLFFKFFLRFENYTTIDVIKYPYYRSNNKKGNSQIPQWLRLLNLINKDHNINKVQIPINKESLQDLESFKNINNFDSKKIRISIGPGSKMPSKRWPIKYFSELGLRLFENYSNVEIVIVGSNDDYDIAEQLLASWNMPNDDNNFCGKLSIIGSAELIRNCDLFIGNDTGTMHLAAMVGVRCIGIFSARDYLGLWEPFGDQHITIRKKISCSGCMLTVCSKNDNACLKLISVDEVFSLVVDRIGVIKNEKSNH